VEISANLISICSQYPIAVKDAKDDIERVQRRVRDITHILEKLKRLLYSQDKKSIPEQNVTK
jgi:ppGpp synthetase/RelA/SpoT-type nucleotidyltranferase